MSFDYNKYPFTRHFDQQKTDLRDYQFQKYPSSEFFLNNLTVEEREFCQLVYDILFHYDNRCNIQNRCDTQKENAMEKAKCYFEKNKDNIRPNCCGNYCLFLVCKNPIDTIACMLLEDERMTIPTEYLGHNAYQVALIKLRRLLPLAWPGREKIDLTIFNILKSFLRNKSTTLVYLDVLFEVTIYAHVAKIDNSLVDLALDHPNFDIDTDLVCNFLKHRIYIFGHEDSYVILDRFLDHEKVKPLFNQTGFEEVVIYNLRFFIRDSPFHKPTVRILKAFSHFFLHVKDRFDLSFDNNYMLRMSEKQLIKTNHDIVICLVNDPKVIKTLNSDEELLRIKRLLINKDGIKTKLLKPHKNSPYHIYKTDMWEQLPIDALVGILKYAIPEAVERDIIEVVNEIERDYIISKKRPKVVVDITDLNKKKKRLKSSSSPSSSASSS